MAIQYSTTLYRARLDLVESTTGTAPKFQLFTGAMPATCVTADSGTKLSDDALPSDWMGAASGTTKVKAGTWTLNGIAAGTAGYFRIYNVGGDTLCHMQGTVTATGGGGDMTLDNAVIANAQVITVNTFAITAGNI